MDDAARKMLTEEILRECWHEHPEEIYSEYDMDHCCLCGKEIEWEWDEDDCELRVITSNCTFDNSADLWDLEQAIYGMGLWEECEKHLFETFESLNGRGFSEYAHWSHNPARCQTIADWWKERKEKNADEITE